MNTHAIRLVLDSLPENTQVVRVYELKEYPSAEALAEVIKHEVCHFYRKVVDERKT